MLLKSHRASDEQASAPGKLVWNDALATHAIFLPRIPGQPSSAGQFGSGIAAPFLAELSGVVVFGVSGEVPLALQCAGRCELYIFGACTLRRRA